MVAAQTSTPEGVRAMTVNVRFASKADIALSLADILITPESGHQRG
jgi:hypothetical protein